ncbi:MAG: H/ACA RNA-protein complex component Cbf5p [Promethearchaeota archaeon CR_4]|nr:MAG: H/ACA RNA-protein complex component Cbf5p [Candidatus Lokiarchaeota archaeon CR_4]
MLQCVIYMDDTKDLIVKTYAETNPNFGCTPDHRPLEQRFDAGLIILDKPAGPTSHEVARRVKTLFQGTSVIKVGHGGTLDPNATGVPPLALNQATLLQDIILSGRKEYIGTIHLHALVPASIVKQTLKKFQGQIHQRPPSRSAVKRVLRVREIDFITVLEIEEKDVRFKVGCEAGTYIRTLAVAMGEALGCGAHLTALRRTRSGCFSEEQGIATIESLGESLLKWRDNGDPSSLTAIIQPIESIFTQFKKVIVKDEAIYYICGGNPVQAGDIAKLERTIRRGDQVGIFSLKGEIIARGTCLGDAARMIKAIGGDLVKTGKVYMYSDIYPKFQ